MIIMDEMGNVRPESFEDRRPREDALQQTSCWLQRHGAAIRCPTTIRGVVRRGLLHGKRQWSSFSGAAAVTPRRRLLFPESSEWSKIIAVTVTFCPVNAPASLLTHTRFIALADAGDGSHD